MMTWMDVGTVGVAFLTVLGLWFMSTYVVPNSAAWESGLMLEGPSSIDSGMPKVDFAPYIVHRWILTATSHVSCTANFYLIARAGFINT